MRHLLALLALATLAPLPAAAQSPHEDAELQALLAAHARAMGGRAALESVRCMEARLEIEEGGQHLPLRYRACRPDLVRVDVTLPDGSVYSEGHDAAGGWMRPPGGEVVPASPEGAAALRHGAELPGNLYGLHELPGRGHELVLAGEETRDGRTLKRLEITLADGFERVYLVDPATALIVAARDRRSLHPDLATPERAIETRYGDYREIDGIMRAHESCDVDAVTGEVLACHELESVDLDPAFGPADISRPG